MNPWDRLRPIWPRLMRLGNHKRRINLMAESPVYRSEFRQHKTNQPILWAHHNKSNQNTTTFTHPTHKRTHANSYTTFQMSNNKCNNQWQFIAFMNNNRIINRKLRTILSSESNWRNFDQQILITHTHTHRLTTQITIVSPKICLNIYNIRFIDFTK